MRKNNILEMVDGVITAAAEQKLIHLTYENKKIAPDHILSIEGQNLVCFTSCSYLGLEFHEKLKKASIEAIANHGCQFSSSRAYLSNMLYGELESLMDEIFNAYTLVSSTTTLGHISCLPVVVGPNDLVILDHQVHTSVQTAANLLKAKGIAVELIRHNRMDLVEERIKSANDKYNQIWLLVDGVYSMYGDLAPKDSLFKLMDRYKHFRLYVDDAHGMSWIGENGKGYFLGDREIHQQMILATSLSKGFASGGGLLVFPDAETKRLVKTCGSTFITSGPMQPSGLGAAVASAQIHLSEEIVELQNELADKIYFTNSELKNCLLPFIAESFSPVFFIPISTPKLCFKILEIMKAKGFFLNLSTFPAVPMKNSGIRFTVTRLHNYKQIESMIKTLAESFYQVLEEFDTDIKFIEKAFKKNFNLPQKARLINNVEQYKTYHYSSIKDVNEELWNRLFSGKGNFDHEGLAYLEDKFSGNMMIENNWSFDYLIIKDATDKTVLATFFTSCIAKDDLFAPISVSKLIEERRKCEPYYLCSNHLIMGSLFSEGEHLFLDEEIHNPLCVFKEMFYFIYNLQEKYQINVTTLRDFTNDFMYSKHFMDNGFFKLETRSNHHIRISETNLEDFKRKFLSKKGRSHWRKSITPFLDDFQIEILHVLSEKEKEEFYNLYLNVKNRNFDINTFALPKKALSINENGAYEILRLRNSGGEIASYAMCYKSNDCYLPILIGLDYKYLDAGAYRVSLIKVIERAMQLNLKKVHLGFGASFEKTRIGASAAKSYSYVQIKDDFNSKIIELMNSNKVSS